MKPHCFDQNNEALEIITDEPLSDGGGDIMRTYDDSPEFHDESRIN